MRTLVWVVLVAAMMMGVGFGVEREVADSGKSGGEPAARKQRMPPWRGYVSILRLETIGRKLGDGSLDENQQTKIRHLREETVAKVKEWLARPETVEARLKVAETRASGDKDAFLEAKAKLQEVGDGQEFVKAYQKGLREILTEEQLAKLYPPKKTKEDCNTQSQ